MRERNQELLITDKGIISLGARVWVWTAGQSIYPRHVAVRSLLQTTDDHLVRPSAVSL